MKLSDIPPSLFTIIAEALGVFVAERLRLNTQNSVGNFFELFGQVMLTYNAQQQLIQQGPGALPGKGLNKELAKTVANEPLENFAPLLSIAALSQPEVQQELSTGQSSSSSSTPSQSQAASCASSMTAMQASPMPLMAMPCASPPSQDIEQLKQQVASLTEEVLQLKELIVIMQNCMK